MIPSAVAPSAGMETAELVRRSQAGDLDAYGILVTRHESEVITLVAQILGTSLTDSAVEETASDVFALVWHDLRQLRRPAEFSPWLLRRAVEAAAKRAASSAVRIPAPDLAVLRLRYTRGASFEEIATLLGCFLSEAWARLWDAYGRLPDAVTRSESA